MKPNPSRERLLRGAHGWGVLLVFRGVDGACNMKSAESLFVSVPLPQAPPGLRRMLLFAEGAGALVPEHAPPEP